MSTAIQTLTLKEMQKQRKLGNKDFWNGAITYRLNCYCDCFFTEGVPT